MRFPAVTAVCAALALAIPVSAAAQDVTFCFTGTVVQVDTTTPFPDIHYGDTFTGNYTFNLATPDTNGLPDVGDYYQATPPYGVSVHIGSRTFQTDPAHVDFLVELVNDSTEGPYDAYLFHGHNNLPVDGSVIDRISWQLFDPTAAALSSTTLSAVPPNLADWQQDNAYGLEIIGYLSEEPLESYGIHGVVKQSLRACQVLPDRWGLRGRWVRRGCQASPV